MSGASVVLEFKAKGEIIMSRKSYSGLQAEYISFGDSDIATVTVEGYSGCMLGTVEVYVYPQGWKPGDDPGTPGAQCIDEDENQYIYNWALFKNRSTGVTP